MKTFSGTVINKGNAVAKISVLNNFNENAVITECSDIDEEIFRLQTSITEVIAKLETIKEKACRNNLSDGIQIIESHMLLLLDSEEESLTERIISFIRNEKVTAEYAVEKVGDEISDEMEQSRDEFIRERSEDILQIAGMIKESLYKNDLKINQINEPSIIVADKLTVEEISFADKGLIRGIVTAHTSLLSHTAVLARSMNIPFITGVNTEDLSEFDGKIAAIDTNASVVIAEPDSGTIERLSVITEKTDTVQTRCLAEIYANVSNLKEVEEAVENHACGIGLFRSEFMYMDRDDLPGEDEQYDLYVKMLELMNGKKVIVRTADIGADKRIRSLNLKKENNPALGIRGIRFGFENSEVFETQIRALVRAAYGRNLQIMFPMISSEWEIIKAGEIVEKTVCELKKRNVPCTVPPIGIMIETPAAAIMLDKFAKYVDFVSIGTNDLTQYTLAADRDDDRLAEYCDMNNEAVIRLIESAVETANKNGLPVEICGEAAADKNLAGQFIKMGVGALSLAPAKITEITNILTG